MFKALLIKRAFLLYNRCKVNERNRIYEDNQ